MSNEWKDWILDTIQEKLDKIGLNKIESYKWLGNDDWLYHGYYLNKNQEKIYVTIRHNKQIQAYCID